MRKLLTMLLVTTAVLLTPLAVAGYSNGYWHPYTTTERVAYQAPETRYVCERVYDFYLGHYNNCYYKTEYVTKYRNETVTRYSWVAYRQPEPVVRYTQPAMTVVESRVNVPQRAASSYNTYYPANNYYSTVGYPTYSSNYYSTGTNSYYQGYDHGYYDASVNRSYNPYRYYGYQL